MLRKGQDLGGGVKINGLLRPIINRSDLGIFEATLMGPNVTSANNRAIFSANSTDTTELIRLGVQLGFSQVAQFLQVVQSRDPGSAAAVALRFKVGVGGTTADSDTAVMAFNTAGGIIGSAQREGNTSAIGVPYGQFSRVSMRGHNPAFIVALQSDPLFNQGVFSYAPGGAQFFVARKGAPAQDAGGAEFRAFTGVSTSAEDKIVFRATLGGTGVTASNNEGLWSNHSGAVHLIARENDQAPGVATGVVYASFVNFWCLTPPTLNGQVLFLSRLRGPGVGLGNDLALFLQFGNGPPELLLREGDPAPDCGDARIGTIQRVAASSLTFDSAPYAVLCTLVRSGSAINQALYTGNTGLSKSTLRLPFLRLRKGTLFQIPQAGTTRLTSMSLPAVSFDSTGAGAKGLGESINDTGNVILRATFSDNTVELIRGKP
jgi:hypothetical protein